VVVIVKISGYALLSIREVAKNRPVTGFEFFGFEARPETPGLGVVETFSAAAL